MSGVGRWNSPYDNSPHGKGEVAIYEEFDTVILKDGRIASLDNKDGPGAYTGTVGYGPKTWKIVYLTDDDIERLATKEEIEQDIKISNQELKECGLL